jgi:hypothetical protein
MERIEFTAPGSPLVVSRAIEQYAAGQGSVQALVVPWESDGVTLSMAVTSVKVDGWAIEHTNLGTITLTGVDHDRTLVAIAAGELVDPERSKLTALFERFARQLRGELGPTA